MVPPTKKSKWSFTLREDETPLDGIETTHGTQFDFNGKQFRIMIGPVELSDEECAYPHRHAMLHSLGDCVTKTRAKDAIKQFINNPNWMPSYFKPTDNYQAYVAYMFKSAPLNESSLPTKRTIDMIIGDAVLESRSKKGCVDKTFVREFLCEPGQPGLSWVSRNSKAINDFVSTRTLCDARRILPHVIDEENNIHDTMLALRAFALNIEAQISANGFTTSHKGLHDFTRTEAAALVRVLVLLPNFINRSEKPDNLPGLFFWGRADCGKSFMFSESPAYRKVANDAKGVGRFKQEGDQAAYLLDDWTMVDFSDPTNSSTIRQISLGGTARIKTFGCTEEIRGFVAATSNDIPFHVQTDFPSEADAANLMRNRAALNRRFLTIQFTEDIDNDPLNITWLHDSSKYAQHRSLVNAFDALPDGVVKCSSPAIH